MARPWQTLLLAVLLAACAAGPAARQPDGVKDGVFHIVPVRPIAQLLPIALAATPPRESGDLRQSDLVELIRLDPSFKLDIRYASDRNFMGTPLYSQARAFLQRPAAQALVRVQHKLAAHGLGLLIHDGYRPWYVTKMFWDATPPAQHQFVANPASGSRHNRGCAIDLALVELGSGRVLPMPSVYDEFSERAHADWAGGSAQERANRKLLRDAMEAEGFAVYEFEWWHFDYKDWRHYPIGNLRFEDLSPQP